MSFTSRIPGFYRLPIEARRKAIAELSGCDLDLLHQAVDRGLEPSQADKVVENVLGIYGLPFGIALNFLVNGRDHLLPMVVEEPSVIAAASNAARMVRQSGGFQAQMVESLMTAQVQLHDVTDEPLAAKRLSDSTSELLVRAAAAVPNLIARGGGPRSLEVRCLGQGYVVLHIHVDCKDAMGANLVNTIAEAVGPLAAKIAGATLGLRILSNLCDRRRVHVKCKVRVADLVRNERPNGDGVAESGPEDRASWAPANGASGQTIAQGITHASRFAELDPYRAATHNKGVMNGLDAVCIATGNDFRAVEAGAHAYAARSGRYQPLATWSLVNDHLEGNLELPLALGIVGGTLRIHPTAKLALRIAGVQSADELSILAAAAGLASNLAALRALASEGIQRGHMSLHARSIALEAGAIGDEVEHVAEAIAAQTSINLQTAQAVLRRLRDA
ncbi:MAG TPA: hydroxymethylglutaryl-CoA reductase, degradative [Polyangiaceae bacterium]|nr:hydroxymethylglutaryl-CoA reductase, degradative [Polyangiaceae bacterium]